MRTRIPNLLSVLLMAIIGCLCIPSCTKTKDMPAAETTARGDSIVASLERYKTDHARYPMALADLTPRYLSSIEVPLIGERKWTYTVDDHGEAFVLMVNGKNDSDLSCWYRSLDKAWSMDTK